MVLGPAAVSVQSVAWVVAPVLPLSTVFTRVKRGETAVFVIVQVTLPPLGTVTEVPVSVPPVHDQADAVKPAGPASESAYAPAGTLWLVTAAELPAPVTVVVPDAVSVQSAGTRVAPVVPLSTTLTRVSSAG